MLVTSLLGLAACWYTEAEWEAALAEGTGGDGDADPFGDADADADADGDSDSDTDPDSAGDTDAAPKVVGVSLRVSSAEIETREVVALTATASYDDGSSSDVTEAADFDVDDEDVLKIYERGVGQPLMEGRVTVTASFGGFSSSAGVVVALSPAGPGDLVFNEVLADTPAGGDPNRDGSSDSVEDEFIELANYADVTVDLSGATIVEQDFFALPRHTFAEGTFLRAGEAIVVFGGGSVGALSAMNVSFVVCVNEDSALQYGLSLGNEGELVLLVAPDGSTTLAEFEYGDGASIDALVDISMVLEPDVWGDHYTSHRYADGASTDYSPGTFSDGSAFPGPDGRYP